MLTYEQNVKAVLECIFAGYKEELIDDACRLICALKCPEKQEPCEDAISRQAAIKAIEALQRPIMREESNYYQFKFSGMSEALNVVENLPSVTPEQKARDKG